MHTIPKKVFLSSTFIDLKAYREAAVHALRRVGLVPIFMEDFPPDPKDVVTVCRSKVDEADLFVGIYAHRYGYTPQGSNVSIAELEYQWAISRHLPAYLFVIDPDFLWPPAMIDKGDDFKHLEKFKAKISRHVWRKFRDVQSFKEDLLLLGHDLAYADLQSSANRSLRARVLPTPPTMHSVPPYILTTRFIGRERELEALDIWALSAEPVLAIEAIGGVGKSALTWEWAQERASRLIPDLAGTLWWSFYEGGASIASFIRESLAYVEEADPEDFREVSQGDQVKRLLAELRRRRYLLILDGFERLLMAYHRLDPSKLRDDEVPTEHRTFTNPNTEFILRRLIRCNPSKILITTRLMPSALENRAHRPVQGVRHLELQGLEPNDGVNLLYSLGVYGDAAEIRRFLRKFNNHSLLIMVLAGRILDYRQAPGNFDYWLADSKEGGSLRLSELDLKQRRTHILAYALQGLDYNERQLLSRIAVLSDAADYATISALNPYTPLPYSEEGADILVTQDIKLRLNFLRNELISGRSIEPEGLALEEIQDLESTLTRLNDDPDQDIRNKELKTAIASFDAALSDLENRGLLQWDRHSNTYSLHPVVRGYAYDQLDEPDRIQTYARIRDHFESLPPENPEQATDLSGLKNTLQIYRALLGSGKSDLAANLYKDRLAHALLFSIASFPTVIELLTPFFPNGFSNPPLLYRDADRRYIINNLGIALDSLGQSREASTLFELAISLDLASRRWKNMAINLSNYAESQKRLNHLAAAFRTLKIIQELCLLTDDKDSLAITNLDLMGLLISEGRLDEAQAAYSDFVSSPVPHRSYYRPGGAEVQFCWLQFRQGKLRATDLKTAAEAVTQGKNLVQLSEVYRLHSEIALMAGKLQKAAEAAELAIVITNKTGASAISHQLCLARILVQQGRHDEARKLAQGAGQYDWQLAEVYLQIGESEKAKKVALKSYKSAWADGPPHVWFWELERSRQILYQLQVPEPLLPPFEPSRVQTVPYESSIREVLATMKSRGRTK